MAHTARSIPNISSGGSLDFPCSCEFLFPVRDSPFARERRYHGRRTFDVWSFVRFADVVSAWNTTFFSSIWGLSGKVGPYMDGHTPDVCSDWTIQQLTAAASPGCLRSGILSFSLEHCLWNDAYHIKQQHEAGSILWRRRRRTTGWEACMHWGLCWTTTRAMKSESASSLPLPLEREII